MKRIIVSLAILSLLSMIAVMSVHADVFQAIGKAWVSAGGNLPNLSANAIYAANFDKSYGDFESTLLTEKVNGNPVDINVGFVPQSNIGVIGISYDLDNLPATVSYGWRGVLDITVSVGFAYDSVINQGSFTLGGKIIKVAF